MKRFLTIGFRPLGTLELLPKKVSDLKNFISENVRIQSLQFEIIEAKKVSNFKIL